jgi:hypothetical protein
LVDQTGRKPVPCTSSACPRSGGSTVGSSIADVLKHLCSGSKLSSAATGAVQRCNLQVGRSVQPNCLAAICAGNGNNIKCDDSCPSQMGPCPCGVPFQLPFPPCGTTRCSGSMPRAITLCCNETTKLIQSLCGCGIKPCCTAHCDSKAGEDKTLMHEMVHACQTDCAKDDTQGELNKNRDWADCMYGILWMGAK